MRRKLFSFVLCFVLFFSTVSAISSGLYSTRGAGAEVQFITSYDGYSSEEIMLAALGPTIFSSVSSNSLLQYCPNAEKVADEVEVLLKKNNFNYATMCDSLGNISSEFERSRDYCELVKTSKPSDATCLPSESKLFDLCKQRLESEKPLIDSTDEAIACQAEFQKNQDELTRFCRGENHSSFSCPNLNLAVEWKNDCSAKGGIASVFRSIDGCEYPRCDVQQSRFVVNDSARICPAKPVCQYGISVMNGVDSNGCQTYACGVAASVNNSIINQSSESCPQQTSIINCVNGTVTNTYNYTTSSGRNLACTTLVCNDNCPSAPACSTGQNVVQTGTTSINGKNCPTYTCSTPTNDDCTKQTCPVFSQPTCATGEVVSSYSYSYNGPNCPSPSSTLQCSAYRCQKDPAVCASTPCPSDDGTPLAGNWQRTLPSCPAGQVVKTATYSYSPLGCSATPIQCPQYKCDIDCATAQCPAHNTQCSAGGVVYQTTQFDYYPSGCSNSIKCWSYGCKWNSTQAPRFVTGLVVNGTAVVSTTEPLSPNTIQPIQLSVCTADEKIDRDAFIAQCASYRRAYAYASYSRESIDDKCKLEATRNVQKLQKICEAQTDPYQKCKEQADQSKDKLSQAFSLCKRYNSKEKIRMLILRKAELECKKRSLGEDNFFKQFNSETVDLPGVDAHEVELTNDKIVLTKTQFEQLKVELKKDVLVELQAQFANFFGARVEQEKLEAKLKQEQADKLEAAANAMFDLCAKITRETLKRECDAKGNELQAQGRSLANEATAQEAGAGGILKMMVRLFK